MKREGETRLTVLGNPYFTVPPGAVCCVTLKHRNKVLFMRITTTLYAKALPQSALVVLWPYPLRFSLDHPDWGPRTLGWGTTLGTVACRAGRCCAPWVYPQPIHFSFSERGSRHSSGVEWFPPRNHRNLESPVHKPVDVTVGRVCRDAGQAVV